MAPKNPIGRFADTAISTLRNPLDTAGKVVEQAKDTAALGRMVAEQVGKTAVSKAADTAGAVVSRATGRGAGRTETYAPRENLSDTILRPVPDVNEPAHTPAENRGPSPEEEAGGPAGKAAGTTDATTAKKAPATRSTVKKATTPRSTAKKAPAKRGAAKKVTATPADVAEVVEAAVAEDPEKTAATEATTPEEKAAAKRASAKKVATKKATKKAAAKKSTAGDKLPKKATGRGKAPKSAEQVRDVEGADLVQTPAGTPAAGPGSNPDTTEKELHQPGTEGIVEESTAKKIAGETAMLRKAADIDKG